MPYGARVSAVYVSTGHSPDRALYCPRFFAWFGVGRSALSEQSQVVTEHRVPHAGRVVLKPLEKAARQLESAF
jgi:hypothetical protein